MKRCFIEIDSQIDDFDKDAFEDSTGEDFNTAFNTIICNAWLNPLDVFEAIRNHEEIWISTVFIGRSGILLKQMADAAIKHGLKDKLIVNISAENILFNFLPKDCIQKLADRNIKFIYSSDYEKQ